MYRETFVFLLLIIKLVEILSFLNLIKDKRSVETDYYI